MSCIAEYMRLFTSSLSCLISIFFFNFTLVDNMQDDDNDPKRAKVMEKNQRLIQEAKDKINSLEDEALDIPRDLVNLSLLLKKLINLFFPITDFISL